MKIKQLKIINQDESTEVADIGADAINVDYNDSTVKAELDKLNTDNNVSKNNITNLQSGLNTTSSNLALQASRIDNLAHLEEGSTTGDAELIDGRTKYNGEISSSIGNATRESIEDITNFFGIESKKQSLTNGTPLNPGNTDYVSNKNETNTMTVKGGDIIRIVTNRPNTEGYIYNYLFYVYNSAGTSVLWKYDVFPTSANSIMIPKEVGSGILKFSIVEVLPNTNTKRSLRIDDFNNYFVKIDKVNDNNEELITPIINKNVGQTSIQYIKPWLINGSIQNVGNTEMIHTEYIYVNPGDIIEFQTNRPNTSEYVYKYGMVIKNSSDAIITTVANGMHNSKIIIPENGFKIAYNIIEQKINTNEYHNIRVTDFSNYENYFCIIPKNSIDYEKELRLNSLEEKIEKGFGQVWDTSNNLFNGIMKENTGLDSNGQEFASALYKVSDYIPVSKGRIYYDTCGGFRADAGYGFGVVCYYDKNKNFLARYNYAKAPNPNWQTADLPNVIAWEAIQDGYARYQAGSDIDHAKNMIFASNIIFTNMAQMPAFEENNNINYKELNKKIKIYDEALNKEASITSRNEDILPMVNAASGWGLHGAGQWNNRKNLSFLVTTDVHRSLDTMNNAITYLNKIDGIDFGMCLGDIAAGNYAETDGSWYSSILSNSEKNFYTVIGNHDGGNSSDISISATVNDTFNKWIKPNREKMDMPTLTTPYYSVNTDYGVTLIFLNNYDVPDLIDSTTGNFAVSRGAEVLSQTQIDWLLDTLNNVPEGNTVMIMMHSYPYANQKIDSVWSQKNRSSIVGSGTVAYSELVPDIVNAWILGTSLTKTYTPNIYQNILPTITVNYDFSERGEGKFACYLVGHIHWDMLAKSSVYDNQKIIGFAATAFDRWQNYDSDLPRVENTKTQDAITVIGITPNTRKIKLVRVGSNITTDMENRSMLSIDY